MSLIFQTIYIKKPKGQTETIERDVKEVMNKIDRIFEEQDKIYLRKKSTLQEDDLEYMERVKKYTKY